MVKVNSICQIYQQSLELSRTIKSFTAIKESIKFKKSELVLSNLSIKKLPLLAGFLANFPSKDFLRIKKISFNKCLFFYSKHSKTDFQAVSQFLGIILSKFKNITHLDLSNTRLTYLPDSITTLNKLEFLDISSNGLESLPESFANLISLKILLLSNNKLKKLPDSFDKLSNLHTLYLNHNQLTDFPVSILALSQLSYLLLDYNQIKYLPKTIAQLQNLKHLELSNNKLIQIPDEILNLGKLSKLNLSNNCLINLPKTHQFYLQCNYYWLYSLSPHKQVCCILYHDNLLSDWSKIK